VSEDQRDRPRATAGLAHEVHRDTGDAHLVVLIGVDGSLGLAPVIAVTPIGDQLTQIAVRHAVGPVRIPLVQRRTSQSETSAQVIKDLVGHTDRGGLQGKGVRGGHRVIPYYLGTAVSSARWRAGSAASTNSKYVRLTAHDQVKLHAEEYPTADKPGAERCRVGHATITMPYRACSRCDPS
jgi:hypothetical protein